MERKIRFKARVLHRAGHSLRDIRAIHRSCAQVRVAPEGQRV
jgi:hypothetical protein